MSLPPNRKRKVAPHITNFTSQVGAYVAAETKEPLVNVKPSERTVWTPDFEFVTAKRLSSVELMMRVNDPLIPGMPRVVVQHPGSSVVMLQDLATTMRLQDLLELMTKGGR